MFGREVDDMLASIAFLSGHVGRSGARHWPRCQLLLLAQIVDAILPERVARPVKVHIRRWLRWRYAGDHSLACRGEQFSECQTDALNAEWKFAWQQISPGYSRSRV